jgi:hypothetical protein
VMFVTFADDFVETVLDLGHDALHEHRPKVRCTCHCVLDALSLNVSKCNRPT